MDENCGQFKGRSHLPEMIKSQLLAALDLGSLRAGRAFVLGATNRPWDMDSAFLRRFQKKLVARQALMRTECGGTPATLDPEQWDWLAARTEGFSAAELAGLAKEALFLPVLELGRAAHWRTDAQGLMEPCSRNAEGAVPHSLAALRPDQVAVRDVTFEDFQQALRNSKRSVTAQEMEQFRQFTEEFGQLQ
ncbi:uncharacterized protein LOC134541115 isoform X2 [Bacillus rossius redtenbacheri]|uniref:uncharacterized protein LOC134541115 isoform X2 n=1 Tax=Bacillus rossius redtenbacheri TaxID=93214 RepID=UPI002FDE7161